MVSQKCVILKTHSPTFEGKKTKIIVPENSNVRYP